jgi:trigger factor
MNIAEKHKDGLNRIYTITVTASELAVSLEEKILSLAPTMNIKGFRKGKVPVSHVRRTYGKSIMAEMLNDIVQEGVDKSYALNNVRPASNPEIDSFGDVNAVIEGKADLVFDVSMDILPDFEVLALESLEIKRPVASASDEEVQTALEEIAKQSQAFETKKGKAKAGDQVVCDFLGKLNGVPFEGGKAEGASIVIGSNTFIPGFEDALIGVKSGDETVINVTFPAEYTVKELAGQPATFDIVVKDVQEPVEAKIDDALATRIGLSDLAALKEAVKTDIERQFGDISRQKAKRSLLDALDKAYDFDLPKKMVSAEFDSIWNQIEEDKKQGNVDPDDEGKSEADLKSEYTKIAERRVRLGLVLAEIGRVGEVTISDEELGQALMREASRYPGQERQVYDFFQKNQQMMAQLRAPLYEEKVVDHILQKAKVTDFVVTRAELESDDDETADAAPSKKPAKAAAKAKKSDTDTASAEAPTKSAKPKKTTKK